MKKLSAILLVCILAACSAKIAPVNEADLNRVPSDLSGTSLADLQKGRELYIEHCGKCHGLKQPGDYTETSWRRIVPPMAKKAKVSEVEEALILRFVLSKSKPS